MPTDWAVTRANKDVYPNAVEDVLKLTNHTQVGENPKEWRVLIAIIRSRIDASSFRRRVLVFNANYGMFRGLSVASIVLLAAGWTSEQPLEIVYAVLGAVGILSLYRMHHLGVIYARELYASVSNILNQERTDKD